MISLCKSNRFSFCIIAFAACIAIIAVPAHAQLRKVKLGDKMPEFSLVDLSAPKGPNEPNATFTYAHGNNRVLAIMFLSAKQKQSKQAVGDIEKIVKDAHQKKMQFDFVIVTSGQPEADFTKFAKESSAAKFGLLQDADYALWGKIGVIATPTAMVIGKDDTILWVKAGYGFDFAPSFRGNLNSALGIAEKQTDEKLAEVRTLTRDNTQAKIKRHLKIAARLAEKGRLDSAIAAANKARQLDPNSVEAALAIGELFCRTGQSQKALDAVEKIETEKRLHKARQLLISGWARRQLADFETAENVLLESIAINPKASRAFYELGKIYQATEQSQKAIEAYRKALMLIFDERSETNISH